MTMSMSMACLSMARLPRACLSTLTAAVEYVPFALGEEGFIPQATMGLACFLRTLFSVHDRVLEAGDLGVLGRVGDIVDGFADHEPE